MAIKLRAHSAVHPGASLPTESVELHGLSVTHTTEELGVTRQAMKNLRRARQAPAAMAVELKKKRI